MGIAAMLGSPIKRREDPRLITGQSTYVDDIKIPGMLHMAVVRSPYGHARINSINAIQLLNIPALSLFTPRKTSRALLATLPLLFPWEKLPRVWVLAVRWLMARYVSMVTL